MKITRDPSTYGKQMGLSLIAWAVVLLVLYFLIGVHAAPIVGILMVIRGMTLINGYQHKRDITTDFNLTAEQKAAIRKDFKSARERGNAEMN